MRLLSRRELDQMSQEARVVYYRTRVTAGLALWSDEIVPEEDGGKGRCTCYACGKVVNHSNERVTRKRSIYGIILAEIYCLTCLTRWGWPPMRDYRQVDLLRRIRIWQHKKAKAKKNRQTETQN